MQKGFMEDCKPEMVTDIHLTVVLRPAVRALESDMQVKRHSGEIFPSQWSEAETELADMNFVPQSGTRAAHQQ